MRFQSIKKIISKSNRIFRIEGKLLRFLTIFFNYFTFLIMFTIAGREIRSLFLSPIAYVITGIFTFIFAYFFLSVIALYTILSVQALRAPFIAERINIQDLVIRPLFANMSVLLLFIVPIITMRAFAEEKKLGTFELIYTSPLRTWEIVLGKFLGISSFVVFILAVSALFMLPIFKFGQPDKGVILTAYIGLLLMTTAFISAGIFASSITENQVISVIVSFGILLLFWVLGWVRGTLEGSLKDIIAYLSFTDHFQNFSTGMIDTRDIIYYISFTAGMLFLTISSLESRRWRGAY
jgi:ABC-2 type transport system permease protein